MLMKWYMENFLFESTLRFPWKQFFKNTNNETIKMTDIKTVKVERCSPYTFSFETSYSQENNKKLVV